MKNGKKLSNDVLGLMRALFLYRRLDSSYHYRYPNIFCPALKGTLSKITKEHAKAISMIQKKFDKLLEMKKADADWSIVRFSVKNISFDEKIAKMNKNLEKV